MMGGIPSGGENGNKDILEKKKNKTFSLAGLCGAYWAAMGDQGRVRMGPDFWPEQVLSKRLPYLG